MRAGTLYDLLAPVYGRIAPGLLSRVTRRAIERLGAVTPDSVLEVGMGPGGLVRELQRSTSAWVVGVDVSTGMIAQARKRIKPNEGHASLVQADGLRLPFREGAFESVVSLLFLDVLGREEVREAMLEMSRVLAPGGRIIVASLLISNKLVRQGWNLAYKLIPELVGRIHPPTVEEHFDAAGLRVLKTEEITELAGARMWTMVKVRA
jgi:ubiquinone/menaquinone biosynthesis C-methylase UbiE